MKDISLKKGYILIIGILVFSVLLSISFFPFLPERMPSHWNMYGEVDGYSSRLFNVLFFPLLKVLLLFMFIIIPKIDPKRKNIKSFENSYIVFVLSFLLFTLLLQLQVYLWSIGIHIPMEVVMPLLMGGMYIMVGEFLKSVKQNYSIGIRTPWTLDNEKVWEMTHLLGSKLFRISGILSILSVFLPRYSFVVVILSVLVSTFILFIYSFIVFRNQR
jgi:uncharacterized membrane protein